MARKASDAGRDRRRAALWALKIAGTAAGFGYVAWAVPLGRVARAIGRVDLAALAAACAIAVVGLAVGAVRWRVLLAAYGAPHRPSLARLFHVYCVGFFYNTYLPGGVGGDVVRGVVTRASFGERGATASMAVVLVERALGLSGLLLLVAGTYVARPLPGTEGVLPFSALLLALAFAAIFALAAGRRLAPSLPGKLGEIAASLPAIERALPFAGALGLSLVTQALVAITGWVILASVSGGRVSLPDALVVVPLAMAAVYFPFSVGGAGVRESAFVVLCTRAPLLSEADALASSLLLWGVQLAVAGAGGIAQLVRPLEARGA